MNEPNSMAPLVLVKKEDGSARRLLKASSSLRASTVMCGCCYYTRDEGQRGEDIEFSENSPIYMYMNLPSNYATGEHILMMLRS